MAMKAHVLDFTPSAFRRTLATEEGAHAGGVLDDCTDGILALDFALTFAGYSYEARQLTLSILGLLGGRGGRLEVFDKELAKHLNCSDRTIRRWRSAHIKESQAKKFSLLCLEEGDYTGHKRYDKTAYSLNPAVGSYLDATVAEARASDLYQSDRRAAVERSAEEHYGDIPDAPPRRRQRKPRRAPTVKVEQAFVNAARNVEKGRQALQDLSEDSRAALVEGKQGAELRRMLLKLGADITEVLESLPQPSEGEEVDEGLGHFVLTLPAEPRAEDVAAWAEVERRAAGELRVRSRELELRPPWGLQTSAAPEEELEAEAIRAEARGEL
jgi:hypothetical protein